MNEDVRKKYPEIFYDKSEKINNVKKLTIEETIKRGKGAVFYRGNGRWKWGYEPAKAENGEYVLNNVVYLLAYDYDLSSSVPTDNVFGMFDKFWYVKKAPKGYKRIVPLPFPGGIILPDNRSRRV